MAVIGDFSYFRDLSGFGRVGVRVKPGVATGFPHAGEIGGGAFIFRHLEFQFEVAARPDGGAEDQGVTDDLGKESEEDNHGGRRRREARRWG